MRARSRAASRRRWALAALALALILLHPLWLGALGDFLVARDELHPADAIVVLAGNSPYRAEHAVQLYKTGWAPRLLISNELVQSHGVTASWEDLRRAGLVRLDVPEAAILLLPEIARNTQHEAIESRDVMLSHGWRSAILVTDPFHTRRALWIFRDVWGPAGLEIIASPADRSKYSVDGWWRDPDRAIRVLQEYVKLPYYLLTRST